MERYGGEELGKAPHIVVLGSYKVGNFVVSTPVLRGLRMRFPNSVIGFIGSEVTKDFEESTKEINWRTSWDNKHGEDGLKLLQILNDKKKEYGPIELAVNLDGFNPVTCTIAPWLQPRYIAGGSLTSNLRSKLPWGNLPEQKFLGDDDWDTEKFLRRYSTTFESNYIASLFCHMTFVSKYSDSSRIDIPWSAPKFEVPEILIHCTTARSAKVWPFHKWLSVIKAVNNKGWRVGLVGSPPKAQRESYNSGEGEEWLLSQSDLIDLRGRTNLIELAGACKQAKAVISVDAGPMHIAAAVGTPTFVITGNDKEGVGASPIRLWLPRVQHLKRAISSEHCNKCAENNYLNDHCLVANHPCMAGVSDAQVIEWISSIMEKQ